MNLLAQRDAVNELHGDKFGTVVLANLIDVRDVRMIECRGRLCFTDETFWSEPQK